MCLPGDIAVGLTDEKGKDVPITTTDMKDGTFKVEYEPKTPGVYTVMVYFAEQPVPQSPIKVTVETSLDTSGITVEGLAPSELDFCLSHFSMVFPLVSSALSQMGLFQGTCLSDRNVEQ